MKPLQERHVIVLVDDESAVLSALRRCLRREPYFVLSTNRPGQALRWVETIDVSAVVSDERMPEMTGTELLSRVTARSPVTSRIILTAYGAQTARLPNLRRCAQCVIAKPWDDAMLRSALREFLLECDAKEACREDALERKDAKEDPHPGGDV